jgi:hypothetical protein
MAITNSETHFEPIEDGAILNDSVAAVAAKARAIVSGIL